MFRFVFAFSFLISLYSNTALSSEWESVQSAGLSVLKYIPSPDSDGSRSLLVALHGCAQKNEHLMSAGNFEKSADQYHTVVLAPLVPNGGVIAGCWDFYGDNHTRDNRMNGYVINLIQEALKDPELAIDPTRVFVTGISSGAGEALVLGCLAPDLIRGVGLVAGVALGHQSGDIALPKIAADTSLASCERLAGANQAMLMSQKVSIIYGTNDYIVNNKHSKLMAEMFTKMRSQVSEESFSLDNLEGENTKGTGTLYFEGQEPFMSVIENKGLTHAWPAGVTSPGRAPFVSGDSVDYPAYLLEFFLK